VEAPLRCSPKRRQGQKPRRRQAVETFPAAVVVGLLRGDGAKVVLDPWFSCGGSPAGSDARCGGRLARWLAGGIPGQYWWSSPMSILQNKYYIYLARHRIITGIPRSFMINSMLLKGAMHIGVVNTAKAQLHRLA
jgi:hypothetical protein